MKKVIGIFMIMVMVFFMVSMSVSLAERNVEGYYGSEVCVFVENWMTNQKIDEKYFRNTTNEFGYYYGHGAACINDFEREWGVEWNNKSIYDTLSKHYANLELEIKTIGFYEGYNVYLMKAKSTDPIGWEYSYGDEIPYYEGEMIFMAYYEK